MAELSASLHSKVARLCPRQLGIDAAEVEQEARIRLWRALQEAREIRFPASYIQRVAATTAIDAVRRVKARREDPLECAADEEEAVPQALHARPDDSPLRLVERSQVREKVARALLTLEARRRRVVGLHLQGFGSRQIADLLGWTEATARNLVYRGLDDLRRALRATGIESPA